MKLLTVTTGPAGNLIERNIEMPGVLPDEKLTPKMAARAARVAFGHRDGVTVMDNDHGYGYRLYSRSARKLHPEC